MAKTYWQKQQQRKQWPKSAAKTESADPACPVCGAINCDRHQQQPSVKKSSSV